MILLPVTLSAVVVRGVDLELFIFWGKVLGFNKGQLLFIKHCLSFFNDKTLSSVIFYDE